MVSLLSLLANRVGLAPLTLTKAFGSGGSSRGGCRSPLDDDAEAKENRKLAIGAVELFGVGDYLERTTVSLKLFISGMDSSSSTASRREETVATRTREAPPQQ